MLLNDRQRGYLRDKRILELITRCRCLNTDQVQSLIFPGMASGRRKAQMRLKRLTEQGRLQRWRYALDEPFSYYADPDRPIGQMEHTVLLNWMYVWLIQRLKSWEQLHSFQYEMDYGILRCDAFAAVRNNVTGTFRFAFLELDRAESGHKFRKVQLYNDLYESDNYADDWWVPLAKRFPPILMATTTTRQKAKIEKAVEAENRNGLEFQVYLVESLRQEVI